MPGGHQQPGQAQSRIAGTGVALEEALQKYNRLIHGVALQCAGLEQCGQLPARAQFQCLAGGSQRGCQIVGIRCSLRHGEAGFRHRRITCCQRAQQTQNRRLVLMAGHQRRQLQESLAHTLRLGAQPFMQMGQRIVQT